MDAQCNAANCKTLERRCSSFFPLWDNYIARAAPFLPFDGGQLLFRVNANCSSRMIFKKSLENDFITDDYEDDDDDDG